MHPNRKTCLWIPILLGLLASRTGPGWATEDRTPPAAETQLWLLDFPRDTAGGLARGRATIETTLGSCGLVPEPWPFRCSPFRSEASALFLLVGALAFAMAGFGHRSGVLVGCVLLVGAGWTLAGGVDALLPGQEQVSLAVVVQPKGPAERELWLGAHYDTKTEPFDHTERAIVVGLVLLSCLAALVGSGIGPGSIATRVVACIASASLLLASVAFGTGRFVPARSHGILDDGAAVLLLLELACRFQDEPPTRTRIRFVFWAGEEVGAQGSSAYASSGPTDLPRSIVNLEGLGAGPDLGYAGREWTGRTLASPPETWVRALARAAPTVPRRIPYPVVTDAGPFLRRGDAVLTLFNLPQDARRIRGLHGLRDRPAAFDPRGLDQARRTLLRLVSDLDRRP